ncbi:hypothetical protein [Methanobrevibacter sp.]|uniref:hypothetical protein n=1 Tax=Methanobrevibacter sp. TaxID=66852 RepID=UPI0026DF29F9|nr:hypothetical protein [Methanobrevibacter sp.]MDO5824351.1 hypothetical protein [Methanobrevibacter sp.]
MIFDKFKKIIKLNNNHYWYDLKGKFFYIPETKDYINITAFQALIILGDFLVLKWDAEDIFNTCDWSNDVDLDNVKLFISKYSEGLLDEVLEWICDNNIECNDENKLDYLSKYNL